MHTISQGILDVALASKVTPAYNFVHPRPVQWDVLIKDVSNALSRENVVQESLPILPYEEWLSRLEAQVANATPDLIEQIVCLSWFARMSSNDSHHLYSQPAIKLADFFRGLKMSMNSAPGPETVREAAGGPMFATEKSQQISEEIAHLPPLSEVDASMWIKYWKTTGFIH